MEIRQEAGKMVQTNSKVGSAELLAAHLLNPNVRRYRQGEEKRRKEWLYQQIGACCFISHIKLPAWEALTIDTDVLDTAMMEDPIVSNLTSVEIQDAFRAGVSGIYGEFYGITPKSLFGFLKSYCGSEKKIEAHRLITMNNARADREAGERLWKEIEEAKRRGEFKPSWGPGFRFGQNAPNVDSEAHRGKIRAQAEQIYKHKEI